MQVLINVIMNYLYSQTAYCWLQLLQYPPTQEQWFSQGALDLHGAQTVKNLLAMWETQVQSLDWKDPPGEGNSCPLQYSCLENPMIRGAWPSTVYGVPKSQTPLSTHSFKTFILGFPLPQSLKNLPEMQETWVWFWVGKSPWRRKWQPTPVFLPGESHGQRRLVGYSLWGHKSQTWLSN